MDSKLLISSTMAAPTKVTNVPTSSTGIRAPLTLDDDSDFEYSGGSTSGKKDCNFSNSSGESEFLSDGFVSDEERPFVSVSDSGILEETHFVKKYVVSRPIVKDPNEETFQESSSSSRIIVSDDLGTSMFDPNEEVVEDNDNLDEYIDKRSFVAATIDRTMGVLVGEGKNVNVGIAVQPQPRVPIANLSWDSDDGFVGSETSEDESFLGVARVPYSGFQERSHDAPKVRVLEDSATENASDLEILEDSVVDEDDNEVMNSSTEENHLALKVLDSTSTEVRVLEVEEVEDSTSITEDVSGLESLEDSIIDGGDNEVKNSSSEDNHLALEQIVLDSTSEEVKVLEVEEVEDSASITEDVPGLEILEDSVLDGGDNEVMGCSREENLLELEQIVPDSTSADAIEDKDRVSTVQAKRLDLDSGIKEADHSNLIVEETSCVNMLGGSGAGVVEDTSFPCEVRKAEAIEVEEAIENFGMSTLDNESHENQIMNAEGIVVCSGRNDSEKLMNENEQNAVESRDCNSPNNTESVGGAMECYENYRVSDTTGSLVTEDELHDEYNVPQALPQCSYLELVTSIGNENDSVPTEEEEDSLQFDVIQSGDISAPERVNSTDQLKEHISSDSLSCGESSQNDEMTGTDSKNEPNTEGVLEEEEVSDSRVLDAPPRTSTGAGLEGGNVTFMSADGTRLIPLEKLVDSSESNEILSEKEKKLEQLQQIRVKFLRLVHKLKQSPEDPVAAKALYQLSLASGRPSAQEFGFEFAKQAAMELEAESSNNLDFSLKILVIGKSGVGKSATINSIFGEDKTVTNAFEPATTGLKEVKGILNGVQVHVLDTPGLRSSLMDQSSTNRKILLTIKKYMKKFSPDIVLYVDRLDHQTRDLNDLPLLKSFSSYLGSSIWFKTILTLTHAASIPPEGPCGNALSYELFVAQRSHAVRELICHSTEGQHILKPNLIPVSLVENSSRRREMNENDQILPPYEENWRSKLLLLCCSMKILSETVSIIQPRDALHPRRFFGLKLRSLPLPYFLSSLLQSNAHTTREGSEDLDSDIESAYLSRCDEESEDEYDQLPPFRPLRKSQIAKLDKKQRKAYFEEYDYRVKLLQKKQLKEEARKSREIKKNADIEEESPKALAVPLPDMALPTSFDGDNHTYRYRALRQSSRILMRPILDSHGWDHDCGFDGVQIEDNLAIAGQFPAAITVELTKDKRKFNIHLNSSVAKHGEKGSIMAGLDIQTIGKQLAYTLKTETKMKDFKVNNSAAGISISFFDGNAITGLKVEDEISVGKNLILVGTTGLTQSQNDAAFGANLAIRIQDEDCSIEQDQHFIGFSVTRWRGENMLGLNLQSQFSLGRNTKMGIGAGLNSKRSGQVSVGISSSDDLHIAALGLVPIAKTIINCLFGQNQ